MRNIIQNKGYAVLELIFYISLFVILSVLVINSMVVMTQSFKETTVQSELSQSGMILERISREIRGAYSIASISASNLVLNTKDGAGANKTVQFVLSGSNIRLLENTVFTGNLNTPTIVVTALNFTQITTAQGVAVKISITVRSTNDKQNRTETFYNTVVLRGAYE